MGRGVLIDQSARLKRSIVRVLGQAATCNELIQRNCEPVNFKPSPSSKRQMCQYGSPRDTYSLVLRGEFTQIPLLAATAASMLIGRHCKPISLDSSRGPVSKVEWTTGTGFKRCGKDPSIDRGNAPPPLPLLMRLCEELIATTPN